MVDVVDVSSSALQSSSWRWSGVVTNANAWNSYGEEELDIREQTAHENTNVCRIDNVNILLMHH